MKHARLLAASTALFTLALAGAATASPAGIMRTFAAPPIAALQANAVRVATPVALSGTERTQTLAAASRALASLRSVQGRFTQAASDGSRMSGQFYLQRPGRARFAYDGASGLLVVSDGATLAWRDAELGETTRAPLRSTPLYFVLKEDLNLERDFRITQVVRRDGGVAITARDRSGEIDGALTFFLEGDAMRLRSWETVDATGARIQVRLDTLESARRIDPRLFILEDGADRTNRGRGR